MVCPNLYTTRLSGHSYQLPTQEHPNHGKSGVRGATVSSGMASSGGISHTANRFLLPGCLIWVNLQRCNSTEQLEYFTVGIQQKPPQYIDQSNECVWMWSCKGLSGWGTCNKNAGPFILLHVLMMKFFANYGWSLYIRFVNLILLSTYLFLFCIP